MYHLNFYSKKKKNGESHLFFSTEKNDLKKLKWISWYNNKLYQTNQSTYNQIDKTEMPQQDYQSNILVPALVMLLIINITQIIFNSVFDTGEGTPFITS